MIYIFVLSLCLGRQYRSVDCSWGGKQCLGFRKNNVKTQNFCNEPDIRKLFQTKINDRYTLRCTQRKQVWQLCYNEYCKSKHECVALGDRKFR